MSKQVEKQDVVKAWLIPHTVHGQLRFMIQWYDIPQSVRKDRRIGDLWPVVEFIELTPEQSELPLPTLIEMYTKGKWADGVDHEEETAKNFHLLENIIGIIKTSNQEGEVANAKVQYKKITGKDFEL